MTTNEDITAAYRKLEEEADAQAEQREAELAEAASQPKTTDELFEMFGRKTRVRCGCVGVGHRGPRPTDGVSAVWLGKTYERCFNCGRTVRYNRVITK